MFSHFSYFDENMLLENIGKGAFEYAGCSENWSGKEEVSSLSLLYVTLNHLVPI